MNHTNGAQKSFDATEGAIPAEVLFVDDEEEIRLAVKEYLIRKGYAVTTVDNGLSAFELVKEKAFDVVLTDLKMPNFSGLELLKGVKALDPDLEVVILTGHGTVKSAVEALKLGGYDYIQKPIKLDRLGHIVEKICEKRRIQKENSLLKGRLQERYRYDDLIGASPEMQQIYEIIAKVSDKDSTVLIQGESGTGKEVVARVIQKNSVRKDMPFVSLNCSAIVEGLLESELFGHVKGAFTGAVKDRSGLFQSADRGTIFLDEVSEMPQQLQVKLLRAIQEKKIRPVGSSKELDVDVRIIAATNRNMQELLDEGRMRNDLFYRLNVISIIMPPLRERKEDIPLLANYFIGKFRKSGSLKGPERLSPKAMYALLDHPWPGNVRELENVIERGFALGQGNTIELMDLPPEVQNAPGVHRKKDVTEFSLRENEIALIRKALLEVNGKRAQAAKLLEIDPSTLYRKLAKYEIQI
ncbi:MAG: sigma-54 dependent transcriptional regulator [Deltaproteobacteria bacterium]|nr:sigma-54 dependent transcriptional regulator [Deltaproteobacteria bacterium]